MGKRKEEDFICGAATNCLTLKYHMNEYRRELLPVFIFVFPIKNQQKQNPKMKRTLKLETYS